MSADMPFHMHQLMKITEIDAFSAQKNAGSRAEYFALLDAFLHVSPVVVRELTEARKSKDSALFQRKIFELQKLLLPIGAMSLLWEAEKAVDLARRREWSACSERTAMMTAKIKRLEEKLYGAQASGSGATSANTTIVAMARGAGDPNRPKARFELQHFVQLRPLVDNFATDLALDLLRDLMISSYGNNIDSILARLYAKLANYDQDGAERQLNILLRTIQATPENTDENAKKKILAVDDMPEILNSIKAIAGNDYSVYCVSGSKAALKFLTATTPDLILMDIEMPAMSGFTLLEIIRRMQEHQITPVLFLTGSVTVENILSARAAGGNDFLKKPIDSQVLMSKIKKHLEIVGKS